MEAGERQGRHQAGPARRRWFALLLCLLFVIGGTLHVVHDAPAFAGTGAAQTTNAAHQPESGPHEGPLGIVHCQSTVSCPFFGLTALSLSLLDASPSGWSLGRAALGPLETAYRHFRPPRLPAHA